MQSDCRAIKNAELVRAVAADRLSRRMSLLAARVEVSLYSGRVAHTQPATTKQSGAGAVSEFETSRADGGCALQPLISNNRSGRVSVRVSVRFDPVMRRVGRRVSHSAYNLKPPPHAPALGHRCSRDEVWANSTSCCSCCPTAAPSVPDER